MKDTKKRLAFILSLVMAVSMVLTGCDDKDESSSKKKKKSDSSSVSSSVIDESSSTGDDDQDSNKDSSSEDVIPGSVTEPVVDSEPEKTTTNTTTTKKVTDDSEPDEYPIDYPPDIDDPSLTTTTTKKAVSLPADEIGDEAQPIMDFFDGIENGDMKLFEKSICPQMVKSLKDKGSWANSMDIFTEQYKNQFGDDYKIDVVLTGKTKYTDEEVENFNKEFEYDFGENPDIKEIYDINMKATIKGSKDSDSDESHVIVGRIGEKWYIFDL